MTRRTSSSTTSRGKARYSETAVVSTGSEGRLSEASIARLALLLLPGKSAKDARGAFNRGFVAADGADEILRSLEPNYSEDTRSKAIVDARSLEERSDATGVRIIALDDPTYPLLLKAIATPPPFLYARGTLPDWSLPVAVVGTREPDSFAVAATERAVYALAHDARAVVVSGLALGIDTTAHVAALRRGLRTVAVLSHGLDSVYPKGNTALAEEIVASGGALISELPLGVPSSGGALVARDRLQSGLSLATIVMQTSLAGGTMHTARFTLEQGRTLIALRPPVRTDEWAGNALLHARASSINWKALPDTLRPFSRYVGQRDSLALRMPADKIDAFIHAGITKRFDAARISEVL